MTTPITSYSDWTNSLRSRGYKTTSLNANEANFADYTNALSNSLKEEVLASFDNKQDYVLQSKLASLLGNKNLVQSTDLKKTLVGSGINFSVTYQPTTYITDNKASSANMGNKNAHNGSVAVYTFSDGQGGEIKIADTNGNGALETEELFMNELLGGIASDISGSPTSSGIGALEAQQQKIAQLQEQLLKQQEEMLKEQTEQLRKQQEEMLQKTLDTIAKQQEELTKNIFNADGEFNQEALNEKDENGKEIINESEFEEILIQQAVSRIAMYGKSPQAAIESVLDDLENEFSYKGFTPSSASSYINDVESEWEKYNEWHNMSLPEDDKEE